MEYYKIRKYGENGNYVETVADEVSFGKMYKPMGWKIYGNGSNNIESSTDEFVVKETIVAEKKKTPKKFDDKLVKGE